MLCIRYCSHAKANNMGETHFASNAVFLFLFLVCLGPAFGCCQTELYTVSGSNNTTVIVGQNLMLTCNFSHPISHDMIWTVNTTGQIGLCSRNSDACYSFDASKFSLDYQDQQVLTLRITNVSVPDAGLYQCGLGPPSYLKLHAVYVYVKTNFIPKVENPQISPSSASARISEERESDQRIHSTTVHETTQSNLIEGKSDSTQGMWKCLDYSYNSRDFFRYYHNPFIQQQKLYF